MKHLLKLSIFFLLILTACSPSGYSCKAGICIRISVEGPVQALVPARFVISVKTDKDIKRLPIGFTIYPGLSVSVIEKIPENAKLIFQDHTIMDWEINTIGGEESQFIGHIILAKPTVSYGIFSYSVMAHFSQPDFGRVSNSVTIYLDSSGMQVEEGKVKTILQTGFPAPTPPPDLTIVPETLMPTVAWPTAMPLPSPTPIQPAYPAPGKQINTAGANQKQPFPSPTQEAFPNP